MKPEIYMSEQEWRSLVWAPQPPYESTGAHDCRMGGSCGIGGYGETRRSRWVIARFRWLREQRRGEVA